MITNIFVFKSINKQKDENKYICATVRKVALQEHNCQCRKVAPYKVIIKSSSTVSESVDGCACRSTLCVQPHCTVCSYRQWQWHKHLCHSLTAHTPCRFFSSESFSQSCSNVVLTAVTGVTSSCVRSSSHSYLAVNVFPPAPLAAPCDVGTDNIQPSDTANPHV